MTVSKVTILDGCISCALCEQICPEVFEIPETAKVKAGVDLNKFEDKIREAADSCPVSVIKVE
ncbi:MAG: ferredoxin [Candidatus Margulisiibacteriota bacterium]|jgi:ferredoxin